MRQMLRVTGLLCSFLIFACKSETKYQAEIRENWTNILQTDKISVKQNSDYLKIRTEHQNITWANHDLPKKKIYTVGSSAVGYLQALGELSRLEGVISEGKYIYSPMVAQKYKSGELVSFGTGNELMLETVLKNRPDLVISSPNLLLAKYHKQIEANGIPLLLLEEYAEKHPLNQAAYVKLYGVLLGDFEKAERLFSEVEQAYKKVLVEIAKEQKAPKVIAGVMYGDVWFAPSENSLTQAYFSDLGLDNVLEGKGSRLGFETVLQRGQEVDFWLNAADFESLEQLKNAYKNYGLLPVVQKGAVYNWSARRSATGANDYFEMGVVRPDWVLQDLAAIVYPKQFPMHKLIFYRKLD